MKAPSATAGKIAVPGGRLHRLTPAATTPPSTRGAPTASLAQLTTLERQISQGPGGRILTHTGVWSPDGAWIVYDTRGDPAGEVFDGRHIEVIHVPTGKVRRVFTAAHGAHCGVATFHPRTSRVVFILGPEQPSPDWSYSPCHRRGVMVDLDPPSEAIPLDARDLTPPFTPGALRGGSHVHVWDTTGDRVSFTYEDDVLARLGTAGTGHDHNQRNIGVSVVGNPVSVRRDHPRNHDGTAFTVLVTRTVNEPRAGSDDIARAFEEAWVGTDGYVRPDGSRQSRALAFQGRVRSFDGTWIDEVFVVDLPADLTRPGDGPLAGTDTHRPFPPTGVAQRRLTLTADRTHPGIQGPRHWLRSSPDGSRIGFLMRDDQGIAQLWTVSPNGGAPRQVTRNRWPIASAFTWSPDGRHVAHVLDNSVCRTEVDTGRTERLTPRSTDDLAPRPEACVFSPDGRKIAFVRRVPSPNELSNQIAVVELDPGH